MRAVRTQGLLGSLLVPLFFATFATSVYAAGIDDLILLKNGGRLRGTVVEEDPAKGVRIKLADGSIRTLKPEEVQEVRYGGKPSAPLAPATPVVPLPPAPPPPQYVTPTAPAPYAYVPLAPGSLHVESAAPGKVSVDGGQVGPAPVDVGGLAPGKHRVRIEFDSGEHREDVVLIQQGQTLQWSFAAPVPSNVKPFQLELGAYLGYGTGLGGAGSREQEMNGGAASTNPFGVGIGARAGILFYRVYVGVDVTYFVGSSMSYVEPNGNSGSYTSNAISVAPRAGYDIHFNDGFVTVGARPYLGFEAVLLPALPAGGISLGASSSTQWNFAPGVLLSAGIGSLVYVGVDARLSLLSDAAESFSVFATGGVRLF